MLVCFILIHMCIRIFIHDEFRPFATSPPLRTRCALPKGGLMPPERRYRGKFLLTPSALAPPRRWEVLGSVFMFCTESALLCSDISNCNAMHFDDVSISMATEVSRLPVKLPVSEISCQNRITLIADQCSFLLSYVYCSELSMLSTVAQLL